MSTVRKILAQCSELILIRSRSVFQEQPKVVVTLVCRGLRDQVPTTALRNPPSAIERNNFSRLVTLRWIVTSASRTTTAFEGKNPPGVATVHLLNTNLVLWSKLYHTTQPQSAKPVADASPHGRKGGPHLSYYHLGCPVLLQTVAFKWIRPREIATTPEPPNSQSEFEDEPYHSDANDFICLQTVTCRTASNRIKAASHNLFVESMCKNLQEVLSMS